MQNESVLNRDAVGALYSDHHHWLYLWLRRKLGCADTAADLAQDTFMRILAARNAQEVREPRAYLATIARGLVVNYWQRRSLERAYLETLATLPEAEAPSPEQRWLVLETLHEIDAMLSALPQVVRSAFLLSQIEGMKYEDIARQLNISLTSVKRYMQQAFHLCLKLIA